MLPLPVSLLQSAGRASSRRVALAVFAFLGVMTSEAAYASSGAVKGTVALSGHEEGEKRPPVLFFLENAPGQLPKRKESTRVAQRDLAFVPEFTVVVKGETVEFPNDDRVYHNVFSLSRAARFDLGLYQNGSSKSVTFKREGVVDVFCNIHPQMIARIRVVPNAHYALTDDRGAFQLDGVPEGTWKFVAWEAGGAEHRGTVTVKAGETSTVAVTLEPQKRKTQHLRKDGTPYGRYQ